MVTNHYPLGHRAPPRSFQEAQEVCSGGAPENNGAGWHVYTGGKAAPPHREV